MAKPIAERIKELQKKAVAQTAKASKAKEIEQHKAAIARLRGKK